MKEGRKADDGGSVQGPPDHYYGQKAVFRAKICYNIVRIYCWIMKKKDTGRVYRNPRSGFHLLSPSHVGPVELFPLSNMQTIFLPRELIRAKGLY
jgi:hypothetical protein